MNTQTKGKIALVVVSIIVCGQLGTAQCSNTKEALQACWISVAFACVFVVAYSFIGPLILV